MRMSLLRRVPMPVKLGVPVAAGLLAAACGTAAGSTNAGSPAAGTPASGSATATVIESQVQLLGGVCRGLASGDEHGQGDRSRRREDR